MLNSNQKVASQIDVIRNDSKDAIASAVDLNSNLMFGKYLKEPLNCWSLSLHSLEQMATWMLQVPACGGSIGRGLGNGMPAGYTYLGQMITHDIVKNTTTEDNRKVTPWLNLDSVYPQIDSEEYRHYLDQDGHFILNNKNSWEQSHDFSRTGFSTCVNREAKILEPRNDENIILSQIVIEWMKFHNKTIDFLLKGCVGEALSKAEVKKECYEKARKFGILVFQSFVVNDYLHHILSPPVYRHYFSKKTSAQASRSYFNSFLKSTDTVPLEFSHAVFRFGHSSVRDKYVWSFKNGENIERELSSLLKKNRVIDSEDIIEWDRFFFPKLPASRPIKFGINMATGIDIFVATDLGGVNIDEFVKEVLNGEPTLLKDFYEKRYQSAIIQGGGSFGNLSPLLKTSDAFIACDIVLDGSVRGLMNLVIQDIRTSSKVPTAGDIFKAISRNGKNAQKISKILGFDLDKIDQFSWSIFSNNSFQNEPINNLHGEDIGSSLNIDNCPLWLYTLMEAERFPSRDSSVEINTTENNFGDMQKLGPLASFVVADVLLASIFDSEVSIHKTKGLKGSLGRLYEPFLSLQKDSLSGGNDFTFRKIREFDFF